LRNRGSCLPAIRFFGAGDPATAFYLIKDGSVRVSVHTPEGDPVEVATLGTGSHFGEMGWSTA